MYDFICSLYTYVNFYLFVPQCNVYTDKADNNVKSVSKNAIHNQV